MNLFYEAKKVLDKDGKVNPLGPYGKQKLTGREIQVYFRRNKVKDKVVKKAVEVALDLGGAMDIAIKAIKDFYGNKILKTKEVQTALQFANEESFKDSFNMLDEDYKKVIKMYPRDRDWKKLITKYKRDIDKLRNNDKDLPKKVEDELLTWASQTGEVGSKDDAEDFIMSIIDEGTLSEVQNALRYANEETLKEYIGVMKVYNDKSWQKLTTKYASEITSFHRTGKLAKGAEKSLLSWAKKNGLIKTTDPKSKEAEKWIDDIILKKEEVVSEGKNLLPDIQKIVDTKGAAKVGGIMIDMFTASMITQIYGKGNDKNKQKMEKSNISTLVDLAQRMMQKMGDNIAEEVKTTLSEAPYDDKDVKNVEKLQKKLEKMLKEVEKVMKGSGLSAPAFSMVRGGIRKGLESIEKFYKVANTSKESVMDSYRQIKEETLTEGTWEVPDSYPKLVKLNKFLSQKANFKDAQSVHKWHIQADAYFGDDAFSDDIDAYKTTLKGGERSFYDKGALHGKEYLDRMKKYNEIKAGTDLRDVLEKQLSDWTGGVLKFKNHEIVQMPREWYMKDNPNEKEDKSPVKAKLESVDYHTKVIVEKFKRGKGRLKFKKSPPIKVEGNAVSRAQQAAIAIAKKKKNESVMDSYRKMWEESLTEEVQDITVDPKNKKFSSPSDQNYHGMEIAKQARRFGLKSAVLGKHVRIKGAKKKVNDFLRVVIGKESYGDPTNGDYTTPQIDKMLTKGLK